MKRLIAIPVVALALLMASMPGFTGMAFASGDGGGGGGDTVNCKQENTDFSVNVVGIEVLGLQANGVQSCNIINVEDNEIDVEILTDNNTKVLAKATKLLGVWTFVK